MRVDAKALGDAAGIKPAAGGSGILGNVDKGISQAKEILKIFTQGKELLGGLMNQAAPAAPETAPADVDGVPRKKAPLKTEVIKALPAPKTPPPPTPKGDTFAQAIQLANALGLGDTPLGDIWQGLKGQTINQLTGKK